MQRTHGATVWSIGVQQGAGVEVPQADGEVLATREEEGVVAGARVVGVWVDEGQHTTIVAPHDAVLGPACWEQVSPLVS